MKKTREPTQLIGRRWVVPPIGRLTASDASLTVLDSADETWPPLRHEGDWHHSWRWRQLVAGYVEAFSLRRDGNTPAALWCSHKRQPMQLPSGRYYRLDYMEIDPTLRGGVLGAFTVGVIAARALELKSDGIVLGTLPTHHALYTRFGASESAPKGWNPPKGLVPYTFDWDALQRLKEMVDDFIED